MYIFWFLHQTTTQRTSIWKYKSCISFDSYIKPQHIFFHSESFFVVYLLIPTSNHNPAPTRNNGHEVVYLLIPTSNHNSSSMDASLPTLYIFWFLHQTTTSHGLVSIQVGCISFDSYIKPQLWQSVRQSPSVVYLLIPTSNHNSTCAGASVILLYIFWFLHQTTTLF